MSHLTFGREQQLRDSYEAAAHPTRLKILLRFTYDLHANSSYRGMLGLCTMHSRVGGHGLITIQTVPLKISK